MILAMTDDVIELYGAEDGPTSMILAGVHGNERCGVEALKALLPDLDIQKGRVFIAYGNPHAIEKNVRFTESNLNRMFKPKEVLTMAERNSYEYGRAEFLKSYLDRTDVLLDVHASFTPDSQRFILSEPNADSITNRLPFDLVVSGFDAVEPGGTDYYMNSIGKIGICVECGYLKDPLSTEIASQSILDFLRIQGHLEGSVEPREQARIVMYDLYFATSDTFRLAKSFADFERITAGQLLGMDGKKEIFAPKDSVILFARDTDKVGEEAFLLGEYKKDPV